MNKQTNDTSRQAIRTWRRALHEDTELTASECDTVLKAINTSMPCRDAVVIASTGFRGSIEKLELLADDKPSEEKDRLLCSHIVGLINGTIKPDMPVIARACQLLTQLEEHGEGTQAAQPYAVHAWLAWLVDDFKAAQLAALYALAADEDVTLAHIVLTGIRQNVHVGRDMAA